MLTGFCKKKVKNLLLWSCLNLWLWGYEIRRPWKMYVWSWCLKGECEQFWFSKGDSEHFGSFLGGSMHVIMVPPPHCLQSIFDPIWGEGHGKVWPLNGGMKKLLSQDISTHLTPVIIVDSSLIIYFFIHFQILRSLSIITCTDITPYTGHTLSFNMNFFLWNWSFRVLLLAIFVTINYILHSHTVWEFD